MPSTVELALMAGASYLSNRAAINQFPVPTLYGWSELSGSYRDLSSISGFEAISFQRGNEIVISFAGTDFSEPGKDFTQANMPLGVGLIGQQLIDAAKYYLDIKAENPGSVITVTGHSLGGGLAALIGVMFDEQAVTFDQAPFNNSARFFNTQPNPITNEVMTTSVALALKQELSVNPIYANRLSSLNAYIVANTNNSNPLPQDTVAARATNVTDVSTQGEVLSSKFFNNVLLGRTGFQSSIKNSNDGVSSIDLHSLALLTAMLQSGDTEFSTIVDQTLGQASFKLPDLMKILFDDQLFSFPSDRVNTTDPNFLELIVNHQAGVDPRTQNAIDSDDMVIRFTSDLWKLINSSNGVVYSQGPLKNLTNTLITFAMQMYYDGGQNATNPDKEFFTQLIGGVHFDALDISPELQANFNVHNQIDFSKVQGNKNYLSTLFGDLSSYLDAGEAARIVAYLPLYRDWYVGLDEAGLSVVDSFNRGALMLGGNGLNNLTGGNKSDLLVGGNQFDVLDGGEGHDVLIGAGGDDYLKGGDGVDIYYVSDGDTIDDSDGQGVIYLESGSYFESASYSMNNEDLIITFENNKILTIKNYSKGDLGINYGPTQPYNQITVNPFLVIVSPTNGYEAPVNDIVNGGDGWDEVLDLTLGSDVISTGKGNDSIEVGNGSFQINPGAGDDNIRINSGNVQINYVSEDGIDTVTTWSGLSYNVNFTDLSLSNALWTKEGNQIYIRFDNGQGMNMNVNLSGGGSFVANLVFSDGAFTLNSDLISSSKLLGSYTSERILTTDSNVTHLYGFDGNDSLEAGNGSQILVGGRGSDTLAGGEGRDTYIFGIGDGQDTIYDTLDTNGESNTLKLVGVTSQDVRISYFSQSILVEIISSGDSVRLYNFNTVDRIEFDNGLVWGSGLIGLKAGEAHDDTLYAQSGGGVLIGGTGDDTLISSYGSDTFLFNAGDGHDLIRVLSENSPNEKDRILFGASVDPTDVSFTNLNDDLIVKLAGGDQITIEDWYLTSDGSFKVDLTQFADGSEIQASLMNLAGLIKSGTNSNDVLNGTTYKNDTIYGLSGNDTINGLGGDDLLDGGDGDDILIGGLGSNILIGGDGNDSLYANSIPDPAAFSRASLTVTTETVPQTNRLEGGAGNDFLYGDYGSDTYVFNLGDGVDTIFEGFTSDSNVIDQILLGENITTDDIVIIKDPQDLIIKVGSAGDQIVIKNWANGDSARVDQLVFADGTIWDKDALQNAWISLQGTEGSEVLTGSELDDTIYGFGGNDVLNGLDGDDWLYGGTGSDQLYGGEGADTYVFRRGDGADGIFEEGNDGAIDTIKFEDNITLQDVRVLKSFSDLILFVGNGDLVTIKNWFVDTKYQVERFIFSDNTVIDKSQLPSIFNGPIVQHGTNGADIISAIPYEGVNDIYGEDGNDYVIGGIGNDYLNGGAGDDMIQDGAGNNTFVGGAGNDQIMSFGSGNDTYVFNIGDGTDTIYESPVSSNDRIELGTGINFSDLSFVNEFADLRIIVGSNATDQIIIKNWLVGAKIESLKFADGSIFNLTVGTAAADYLSGTSSNDYIVGMDGDDLLSGGHGINVLRGGNGDDTYIVDNSSDAIFELQNGGLDTVQTSVTYTLSNSSDVENLTLTGSNSINGTGNALDNYITGNSANNVLNGGAGNDILDGGAGTDSLIGGDGDDTYIVDSTTDIITETVTGGVDTVQSSVTYTLSSTSNLENLTLTGESAINGTGNSLDNVLIGNSANNTLTGGTGNDTLDGGAGVDTLIGGVGDDTYIIDSTTDTITEYSTGGTDTVKSSVTYTLGAYLENLTLTGTSSLVGYGNTLNNIITGNVGNNTLSGFGGIDTLIGGAGNDVYIVDTATDIIIENVNEGLDTVRSDVSYVLGANIENLILTSAGGAINGTGNALANAITGNNYANILDGGAGSDYLTGGDGNDTYIIDSTGDTIVETATGGIDTVKSSVTYTLGASSNLENLILTGTAALNGTGNALTNFLLGNSANNTLTDTAGGNDILQGLGGVDTLNDTSGNNLLDGGIGADVITAGSGNDLIVGGTGNDTITTGNGYDVIMFNKGDGADTINASVGTDNTISLGGNFAYSDLSLTKSSTDLILKVGSSDQITLKGWYNTGANNKSVASLQVIAEAIQGFSLGGSDALRNNKVETFNFANLVAAFDADGATANWQLTDARLTTHLSSGSDTAAVGGDIAYQYGVNGSLTGIGLLAAQSVINNASVGQSAQALNTASSWASEAIKLS